MSFFNIAWQWLTTAGHWSGSNGVPARLLEHVEYTALALVIAAVIALPAGVLIGHTGRGSLALVGWPTSGGRCPRSGCWSSPSSSAAAPPGLADPAGRAGHPADHGDHLRGRARRRRGTKDAAAGMGMTSPQVVSKVEIPVALPLILLGLRTATIQVVATATIAAYISLGGFGRYILDGLATNNYGLVAAARCSWSARRWSACSPSGLARGRRLGRACASRPGNPYRKRPQWTPRSIMHRYQCAEAIIAGSAARRRPALAACSSGSSRRQPAIAGGASRSSVVVGSANFPERTARRDIRPGPAGQGSQGHYQVQHRRPGGLLPADREGRDHDHPQVQRRAADHLVEHRQHGGHHGRRVDCALMAKLPSSLKSSTRPRRRTRTRSR